ncbi:MAG TPA: HAMP domain-containing sensor histidine kinase, partial [Prolixibacteraceae bacterium]|nr:HAMP domain-containing sensor histidine kinase [Prolixibacteraceae bacterium]
TNQENEDNIPPITKIHSAASQLSQIQKSLLLLSKISNREYSNISTVDLQSLVKSSLETFAEAISLRNISLDTTLDRCFIDADAGLAGILINNLLKNAVKHNISNGFIRIELNAQCFSVANSGDLFDGDPSAMFERFSKGEKGNTGIGLAIVKQICELYGFRIEYSIKDKNIHKISIFFKN